IRPGRGLLWAAVLLLVGCAAPRPEPPQPPSAAPLPIGLAALPGWSADPQSQALPALAASCGALRGRPASSPAGPGAGTVADWRPACAALPPAGSSDATVREFLEAQFRAVAIAGDSGEGLFTGYFEPEAIAGRKRSKRFTVPLYRRPPDLDSKKPYLSR